MNRKRMIIISVTGIFLVLLILVGLTYAYFLTRIVGNTNEKSISVTTANLQVRYEDGTNIILDDTTKLKPSSEAIGTKTFDVINEGDETDYVVIVDNISITDATTGDATTFESNDFVYTLECISSDGNDCEDITAQTTLPLENGSILIGNNIESGATHTYTLTLWYLETNVNQSNDMNKTMTARLNIEDIGRINPYSENTSSLTYNIINNSVNATNGTQLISYPLTKVAEEKTIVESGLADGYFSNNAYLTYYSSDVTILGDCAYGNVSNCYEYTTCNEDVIGKYVWDEFSLEGYGPIKKCDEDGKPIFSVESSLSITYDDYGISYYYRGNVEDNYLNFAGMCWRIVRIDGDNNIKIVLEDKDTTCENSAFTGNYSIGTGNYGYDSTSKSTSGSTLYKMNYLEPVTEASSSMVKAFYDYQSTLATKISSSYTNKTITDYLISGNWCMADRAYSRSGSSSPYTYSLLSDTSSYYLALTSFYYDSYVRLSGYNKDGYNPTLKCTGTVMDTFNDSTPMYVATLTADEIVYAGGKIYSSNPNYYLINDYQQSNELYWWSLSSAGFFNDSESMFFVYDLGTIDATYVSDNYAFRPSVSLKSGVVITDGEGTLEKPYVIG